MEEVQQVDEMFKVTTAKCAKLEDKINKIMEKV